MNELHEDTDCHVIDEDVIQIEKDLLFLVSISLLQKFKISESFH